MKFYKKAFAHFNIVLLFSICFIAFGGYYADAVDSTKRIIGYAWSSNIGWLSFNDGNVTVDGSNNLVGYAWSPNIGWVKFGGLSGFPDASIGTNAKLTDTGATGWARAVSVMNPLVYKTIDNRGGWDGWISLSSAGKTPAYGVATDGKNFSGFAWGSEVVGWLDWSYAKLTTNDVICTSANGIVLDGESTIISTKITSGADKGKCQTQEYQCKDQKLTAVGGPSTPTSCTESLDCEDRDGVSLRNGESYKFFKERVVAGKACEGVNLICKDGILTGPGGTADESHMYTECLSAPNYKEIQ